MRGGGYLIINKGRARFGIRMVRYWYAIGSKRGTKREYMGNEGGKAIYSNALRGGAWSTGGLGGLCIHPRQFF